MTHLTLNLQQIMPGPQVRESVAGHFVPTMMRLYNFFGSAGYFLTWIKPTSLSRIQGHRLYLPFLNLLSDGCTHLLLARSCYTGHFEVHNTQNIPNFAYISGVGHELIFIALRKGSHLFGEEVETQLVRQELFHLHACLAHVQDFFQG